MESARSSPLEGSFHGCQLYYDHDRVLSASVRAFRISFELGAGCVLELRSRLISLVFVCDAGGHRYEEVGGREG